MKKRRLIDFYLPYPWNIHARILFLCAVGALLFGWYYGGYWLHSLLFGGVVMLLDCEIIYWVAKALFNSNKIGTPGQVTFQVLWQVIVFFLMIVFVGTIVAFLVNFISGLRFGAEIKDVLRRFVDNDLAEVLKSLSIGGFVATLMFFFMLWQDAMKSTFIVREKMLIYQSETLKNQVNPHFLFNSLNTLSSLIPVDPEKAEAFTYKLSAIYRYILENREVELVPLEQEIAFVRDFYFLQKIRDEEKIDLSISIENPKSLILPISLQLLVENAFKHNIATREKPLRISIIQNGDWVEVKNNLQPKKQLSGPSGLGLKNLSERVKINVGQPLEIKEETYQFVVRMPLICKK